MKKKLVLSGFFGFDNAGDEAILWSMIQQLEERGYQPIVLSANPKQTKEQYGVPAIDRSKTKDVIRAIRHSDGLISGSGSLLQDVTSAKNSMYYLSMIQLALVFKKPVFMYGQGIGPLHRPWLRRLVGLYGNLLTYRSVRDEESRQLLLDCGVKKQIDVTSDPVLGVQAETVPLPEKLEEMMKQEAVVLSLRSWNQDDAMIPYYREIIMDLNEKGIPVVLLPFHHPHDAAFAKQVTDNLDHELLYVAEEPLTLNELFSCIKRSRLVIAMRLHALIFAANQGIPFLGISYDPKIDSFLKTYDHQAIASVEKFSAHSSLLSIYEMLDNGEKAKRNIAEKQAEILQHISLPMEAIDNYFIGGTACQPY